MRKIVQAFGALLFLVGISGAIDHLWYQPFLGIVLNAFHRLVVLRVGALEGHELVANLGVAALGAVLVLGAEAVRPRART